MRRSRGFFKRKMLAVILTVSVTGSFLVPSGSAAGMAAGNESEIRVEESSAKGIPDREETAVDAAETGPDVIEAGPEETGTDPESTEASPEETGTDPESTEAGLEETGTDPESTEAGPEETGTDPESTEAGLEETGTDPESTEAGSEETGTDPESTESNPEETEEKLSGKLFLTATNGTVTLTVSRKDGSAFPLDTQLQLLQTAEVEKQRGEVFSGSACQRAMQTGWADVLAADYLERYPECCTDLNGEGESEGLREAVWNSVVLFLPYYVSITDGSGTEMPGTEIELTFLIDDEAAFLRASESAADCRIGYHNEAENWALTEETRRFQVGFREKETLSYSGEGFSGCWYSLLQADTGWRWEESFDEPEFFSAAEPQLRTAKVKTLPDNLEIQDGNPAWAPEVLRSGRASTHKRKVVFQTPEGEVVRWAYCLEPLKGNPGEDVYDVSEAVILSSGAVDQKLAKTLYYLYGGPAWGKTVDSVNLKNIMTEAGCTSSDNYYAMTHYVLGYIYNNGKEELWNAHPAESGVLNSKGIGLVKTLVNYISAFPMPYAKLSKTVLNTSYDAAEKKNRSESVTYQAFRGNKVTISLPENIVLVNETLGQSGTGTVTIDGGDTFHFESVPSVSGSRSYSLNCSAATDFTAFKKSFSGDAQDLGFSYYSGEKALQLSVEWPQQGFVKIKKSSSRPELTQGNRMYSLEGARFGVYRDLACTSKAGEVRTDSAGVSAELSVEPGTYYVREEEAPKGFLLNREIKSVAVQAGEEAVVAFSDPPAVQRISKLLRKCVRGNTGISMRNARFTVRFYGKQSPEGEALRTWILKTDDDGGLWLEETSKIDGDSFYTNETGEVCLPLGCLTFTETEAPVGCRINDKTVINYITEEGIKGEEGVILQELVSFFDEPSFIGVRIRKNDAENGSDPQGDGALAGAVFAVISDNDDTVVRNSDRNTCYKKGEEVMRITTDAEGIAQTGAELQAGAYHICEVTAPEGYLLNDTKVFSFQSMKHGEILDLTADAAENQVSRGSFTVAKWDLEKNAEMQSQGDAVLAGALFSLVNRSENSVLVDADQDGTAESYMPDTEILRFRTDADGKYSSPERFLPYGTYELTEAEPPEGYTPEGENISRNFQIQEDGEHVLLTDETAATKNRVIRGDISIYKFRDTLSTEESRENLIPLPGVKFEVRLKSTGEHILTMETDEEGYASTVDRENYPNGRLPYGRYVITETVHPEDVEAVRPFEIFVGRDANGNQIDHFHYKGIYKNDIPIESPITLVKKDGESGRVIPAAGTEFQILDKDKKVITFTNIYPHREKLTNFVTDESGTVNLPEKLPYGVYYLREIMAPTGYLQGRDLEFRVDQSASWEQPLIIEYSDRPAKGMIRVKKRDEKTGEALSGAVFGVFAKQDIITGDRMLHHPAGSLVCTFSVDEQGTGRTEELYLGSYYIQELKAPQGYYLDNHRYDTELSYKNQNTELVFADRELSNKPTVLELKKTDQNQMALSGIRFEITMQNQQESQEFVTDRQGEIVRQYLLPGTYAIKEKETLPGYLLDEGIRYVTVNENGGIFESDENGIPLDEDRAVADTETLHWVNKKMIREVPKTSEKDGNTPTEAETEEKKKEIPMPAGHGSYGPKTGDSTNILLYLALALLSLCGCAGLAFYRKNRYNGEK